MARTHGLGDDDANNAAQAALRGGMLGAAKWAIACAALGVLGNAMSPVYRGLTTQFKIYLHMSGVALGASIDAERSLFAYKRLKRLEYERTRDELARTEYEED